MTSTQKTVIHKERKETKQFYTNSNGDTLQNKKWGADSLENFSLNNKLDDFDTIDNESWPSDPIENNWTTKNTSNTRNTSTRTSKTTSSNLFDDNKSNTIFHTPSLSSEDRNDFTNGNTNNRNLTTSTTLEEGLNSKELKPCTLEDIWKIEPHRYWMVIPVGGKFSPDDVKVSMKNGLMSVVVQKEVISQHTGSSLGYDGFARAFGLPDDGDYDRITTTLTTDGNLRIEVPRNPAIKSKMNKRESDVRISMN